MEAPRMARIFMVLLSFSTIIIAWPAVHQDVRTPYTRSVKDVCNASSTINVCSDDCRIVLDCTNEYYDLHCTGSIPLCHKPPNQPAICSEAARCKGQPLLCAQEGFFPDPYFCSIYHHCDPWDYYAWDTFDCGTSAYNIATGECDLPLDAPVCQDTPVPECTASGQEGALTSNPSYYYRCREDSIINGLFYPLLFLCTDGLVYNEDIANCSDTLATTSTAATTTVSEFIKCTGDCQGLLYLDGSTSTCDSPQRPYCHDTNTYNAVCLESARCYGAPLKCTQSGVFPDPYFCDVYHTCTASSYSAVSTCTDSAFNIATGQCDLPFNDPICSSGPVDPCLSLPQSGPLAGNPNYYYICADQGIMYPLLYRCPDGEVFDDNIKSCAASSNL